MLMLLACAVLPASAGAREELRTLIQDDAEFLHRTDTELRASLQSVRDLGIDEIRVTAGWSVLTREPDAERRPNFDATDPAAYPQAQWGAIDRLARMIGDYGLELSIDVGFWAPRWAARDEPPRARTGIDATAFADFAKAVARRYDGNFVVPDDGSTPQGSPDGSYLDQIFGPLGGMGGAPPAQPLPRVRTFSLWNEPNHRAFLLPQYEKRGGEFIPVSPHVYRRMVAVAYPAMKSVRSDVKILVGGTTAGGGAQDRGTGGVAPLEFVRELACVDEKLRPLRDRAACKDFRPVPGDGFSHHPYSLATTPGAPAKRGRPDDVPIGEMRRLTSLLARLAARGRISKSLADVYITEYGYETNPPNPRQPFSVADQARFLPWAEYLAWREPQIKTFAQFLLRDLPSRPISDGESAHRGYGDWHSGLMYVDGEPKPAFETFRAGLYVERRASGRVLIWGRIRPVAGSVPATIEVLQRGEWVALATTASGAKAAESRFATFADGTFLRTAGAAGRDARYRIRYDRGGGSTTTRSIAATKPR